MVSDGGGAPVERPLVGLGGGTITVSDGEGGVYEIGVEMPGGGTAEVPESVGIAEVTSFEEGTGGK